MRDLKFRVWNPNANEFVAYSGVKDMPLHETGALILKVPVYDVLQYTGLKDKNGVEIYEGDIVEWTNNYNKNTGIRKGFVKWDQLGCCFAIFNDLNDDWADNSDWYGAIDNVEIIGNIYQDPELIKKED